jgi:hypothetical protein
MRMRLDEKSLLLVFVILTIVFASSTLIELNTSTRVVVTSTATVTETCSPAASQQNPLMTFTIDVEYNGPWNATAIGYSNGTANQAFLRCYAGDGSGWILISDWNPNGGAILNRTIQKMDATGGNLTAAGNGQVRSTIAPYGVVRMSLTAVP